MTETQPENVPSFDMADWEQKNDQHNHRREEVLPLNKAALFGALSNAGVTRVIVNFDGFGDSGQIESIDAYAGDATAELPAGQIEIASPVWGRFGIERQQFTIEDAIEHLAYGLLSDTHCGWENNDGAYGDFTFDVAVQSITLDYNERYTATTCFLHEF